MNKRTFILLIGLLFIFNSFADEPRLQTIFESKNGEYSIKYQKQEWKLTNKKGTEKYRIKDRGFTSMTILISDDGQKLVVIDDNMEGQKIGERNAIWLYNNGTLIKTYKLTELVTDTCNISKSIWHIEWNIGDFEFDENQNQIQLSTYEMNNIKINLISGKIDKTRPENFDSDCLIVYGEFRKGNEDMVLLKILKYIAGEKQENNIIRFNAKGYGKGLWRELLMIKNGENITPIKYRINRVFLAP